MFYRNFAAHKPWKPGWDESSGNWNISLHYIWELQYLGYKSLPAALPNVSLFFELFSSVLVYSIHFIIYQLVDKLNLNLNFKMVYSVIIV